MTPLPRIDDLHATEPFVVLRRAVVAAGEAAAEAGQDFVADRAGLRGDASTGLVAGRSARRIAALDRLAAAPMTSRSMLSIETRPTNGTGVPSSQGRGAAREAARPAVGIAERDGGDAARAPGAVRCAP